MKQSVNSSERNNPFDEWLRQQLCACTCVTHQPVSQPANWTSINQWNSLHHRISPSTMCQLIKWFRVHRYAPIPSKCKSNRLLWCKIQNLLSNRIKWNFISIVALPTYLLMTSWTNDVLLLHFIHSTTTTFDQRIICSH